MYKLYLIDLKKYRNIYICKGILHIKHGEGLFYDENL